MNPPRAPRSITVFTRRNPAQTAAALERVIALAVEAGVEVRIPAEEVEKHGLTEREGAELGADPAGDTDLAVVLGGDGTDPHHDAPVRRARGAGVRDQLRGDRVSWPPSSEATSTGACGARSRVATRSSGCPRSPRPPTWATSWP